MPLHLSRFRQHVPSAGPVPMDDQRYPVQTAPDHKRPRAAVPESAEQHRDHDVAIHEPRRPAISAERNVEIITEPGRKADVPAMPEIGNVPGEIGKPEIDRQLVTE